MSDPREYQGEAISASELAGMERDELSDSDEVHADSLWRTIDTAPEDVAVITKIHDRDGARNEQELRRFKGLWWYPDKSMYVYYVPTHWREK